MSDIHLILQGKGGVGKSLIATILAEYFISKGLSPRCIDCDPLNQTFGTLKALKVEKLDILHEGEIRPRVFDDLMEMLLSSEEETFVIDNGSAGFLPLCDYMSSNEIMSLLEEAGHTVFIHSIIVGGESLPDTLSGFAGLASHFPTAQIVLWLNEFFGVLEHSGKAIEDLAVFKEHGGSVFAQIRLSKPKAATFEKDLIELRTTKLTFAEGVTHPKFNTMVRHRLNILRTGFFAALEQSRL